jgi:vesicle-associated membrane protein 7
MASSASSSAPPLIYSCIAHNSTILTEHTTSNASGASNLASLILSKITHDAPQKLTYTHQDHFIHYIADGPTTTTTTTSTPDAPSAPGLTYLVVARADTGRRIPFAFLTDIKTRFLARYPPSRTAFAHLPAYGAAAFNADLKAHMATAGAGAAAAGADDDAFRHVRGEIDGVRGIMTENIERVLERGERIDLLVDKTGRLGGSAGDFRVRSRGLRRRMWWKNVRLMVVLTVVVVFLVYLLVGFGCGLPVWGRCFR